MAAKTAQGESNSGPLHEFMELMNNPMLNMGIMIFSGQIFKRIVDFDRAENVSKFRILFITSQLLQLGFLWFLRHLVLTAKASPAEDDKKVVIEHAANPLTGEKARKESTSARLYDLGQVTRQIWQQVAWFVVILLLHRFAGAVQPLVMQAVMPWRTLLSSPVVRIRIWGQRPVGSLARPFQAAASPLGDMLKNLQSENAPAGSASPKKKAVKAKVSDDDEFEVPPSIEEVTEDASASESAPLRKRL